MGMALGGFFGVTEESQRGSPNSAGWREVQQRRAEVSSCFGFTHSLLICHHLQDSYLTLGRRVSLGRSANHGVVHNEPPPDYSALEMSHVPPSFITAELSDDSDSESDDDAGFLSEAPPDYNTLTTPNA